MVKQLLKTTRMRACTCVIRRNLILTLTNKPTDDQMQEGINAQRNPPTVQ
jgi:hypothetical protein